MAEPVKFEIELFPSTKTDPKMSNREVSETQELSRKTWEQIADDDHRAVVVMLVADALRHLLKDPEEWVPRCITQSGDSLEFRIRFDLENIDPILSQQKLAAESERQNLENEMKGMLSGLKRES